MKYTFYVKNHVFSIQNQNVLYKVMIEEFKTFGGLGYNQIDPSSPLIEQNKKVLLMKNFNRLLWSDDSVLHAADFPIDFFFFEKKFIASCYMFLVGTLL